MLLNIKKFLRKGEELGKLYPMFPSVPLPCIFSIARKSHTANKHPFPAKCKSILPYTFFRQPFRGERSLIIPFLYLPQGILYRIGQFFFFLILNFKLYNDGVILPLFGLQHHIVSAKPAFTVRCQHISVRQLHHHSKYKAMVESFRLFLRRIFPRVKIAECLQCHFIHISIHRLHVIRHQGLQKCIVHPAASAKPIFNHLLEHNPDFHIRQLKAVLHPPAHYIEFMVYCFQVSAGQQQAPYSIIALVQLAEYNLFIKCGMECFPAQQTFHCHFYFRAPLPD